MVLPQICIFETEKKENNCGSGGIRTHAPEETGALNQRLRPLGHATFLFKREIFTKDIEVCNNQFNSASKGIADKSDITSYPRLYPPPYFL